jgi:Flp pilus assembly protein TadD
MKRKVLPLVVLSGLLSFAACARPLASGALTAGVAAARVEDWDEAVRQWTAALERDPRSAAAHNNLAVAFERKGAWEEARREYETALRLEPDNPTVRQNFEAFKVRVASGRAGSR